MFLALYFGERKIELFCQKMKLSIEIQLKILLLMGLDLKNVWNPVIEKGRLFLLL